MCKRIWISWENHRRTRELANQLPDAELHILEYSGNRLSRYLRLLSRTSSLLYANKPNLVFVQNPSVILTLFVLFCSKIFRFSVIVDAHNEGLEPFNSKYNILLPIYRLMQVWAELTIVTNQHLAEKVKSHRGRPFVLEDRIPELYPKNQIMLSGSYNIVYICTFEKDEPYKEIIQSGYYLDKSIKIYITGPNEKIPKQMIEKAPGNITFCGFLKEQDYIDLLYSCDIIMDLTLMENCLVCGAYEAVSLGKPMILSETKATRTYFSKGAIYTNPHPKAIAESIMSAISQKDCLSKDTVTLKQELREQWKYKRNFLLKEIDRIGKKNY